jgi:cytoskeleton protein RodZ
MTSVGDILRSARESQGRAVPEIAEELCIAQRYLRAIEKDDLKSLPGTFFYKSFVRQYAATLGIAESEIQAGIEELTAHVESPPAPGEDTAAVARSAPPPIRELDPIVEESNHYFSDRRIGVSVAALALVLLACSGFYAWWTRPPQVQVAVAPAAPATAVSVQPAVIETSSQPAAQTAAQAIEVSATTNADDLNHVVLNLSATERTWLSITSEGKVIFSGVLQPSQTKTLTGMDVAKVKVGNAGGLEVQWNGKHIGPLGERGQVKTILFTPENFQIVEPVPPQTPETEL